MEYTEERFEKCKNEAEIFYSSIGKIKCPYFNDFIFFNAKGMEHLKFKTWNKTRSQQDQYSRLRHIKLVTKILEDSKTLQGFLSKKQIERVRINKKWQLVSRNVTYYEFIAVLESHGSLVRVKVIVKEIEGGEKFFWSLIPFWGKDTKNGDRVLSVGDPEND